MKDLPHYIWVPPRQTMAALLHDFSKRFPAYADELHCLIEDHDDLHHAIHLVSGYITSGIMLVKGMRCTPVILHALAQAVQAYQAAGVQARDELDRVRMFKATLVVSAGALLHGVGLRDKSNGDLWTIRTGPLVFWMAGRESLVIELQDPGLDDEEAALLCLADYVSGADMGRGGDDLGVQPQARVIH